MVEEASNTKTSSLHKAQIHLLSLLALPLSFPSCDPQRAGRGNEMKEKVRAMEREEREKEDKEREEALSGPSQLTTQVLLRTFSQSDQSQSESLVSLVQRMEQISSLISSGVSSQSEVEVEEEMERTVGHLQMRRGQRTDGKTRKVEWSNSNRTKSIEPSYGPSFSLSSSFSSSNYGDHEDQQEDNDLPFLLEYNPNLRFATPSKSCIRL